MASWHRQLLRPCLVPARGRHRSTARHKLLHRSVLLCSVSRRRPPSARIRLPLSLNVQSAGPCKKTGNDALLLAATLLFTAVGEGRDAAWVLAQCDDRCSLAAEAAAEEEASSEEEDEARASLVDDAWMLLQEDVLRDESGRARLTDPTLLSRALFERVYAAIERRALPLQVASPLVRFCEEFSRLPASDPKHAPALRTLMKVVRTRWPTSAAGDRRGATAAGGVESASDQLDALLASEAYEASREEEGEGADDAGAVGRSGGIGAEEAGPGRLVRAQRRACLLAQCAPRLFPPALLVAYSPSAGRIGHSCVPSVNCS